MAGGHPGHVPGARRTFDPRHQPRGRQPQGCRRRGAGADPTGSAASRSKRSSWATSPSCTAALAGTKHPMGATSPHVRTTGRLAPTLHDFSRVARSLPRATIAGPAAGSSLWMRRLSLFVGPSRASVCLPSTVTRSSAADPQVTQRSVNCCQTRRQKGSPRPLSATRRRRMPTGSTLRSDEINSIACGGQPGSAIRFGAALWALDTLFAMARVGIDGVNFHTEPGSFNELFSVTDVPGWEANVHPEYYGLMLFAQAAPPGARLLRLVGAARSRVHIWATRAADGELHIVLINKDPQRPRIVTLQIRSASGPATIETLRAPSAYATTGVTLGGQTFGTETTTGLLAGARTLTTLTPAVAIPTRSTWPPRAQPCSHSQATIGDHMRDRLQHMACGSACSRVFPGRQVDRGQVS